MRAVVTGGAGFIGSHVVDALIAEHHEVLVLDDFSTGSEENLASARAGEGQVEVEECDICSERAARTIVQFKPHHVFHHAAQINVRRSVKEPAFDAEKNVVGTVNVLEACRESAVEKFVFASTGGAIYGEQEEFPASENHSINPECQYGVGKRAAELYLEYYARAYRMPAIALRYANVFGPRQNPKGEAGVVAIFTDCLFAGLPLTINGDGEQTRDFVYVGDVARANMLVAAKIDEPGYYVYNVGTGVETSVRCLTDALCEAWSKCAPAELKKREIDVRHGPPLPGEQQRSVISPAKIQQEFGWESSVQLRQGLELTIRSAPQSS